MDGRMTGRERMGVKTCLERKDSEATRLREATDESQGGMQSQSFDDYET